MGGSGQKLLSWVKNFNEFICNDEKNATTTNAVVI